MPPQMGSNHGACDVMTQRAARRALVANTACTSNCTAVKPTGAAPEATDKPKRPSRARKEATAEAPGCVRPASTSAGKDEEGRGDGHDAAAEARVRLAAMHARFGGELSFLVTEFTKLEAQLSLEVGGAASHFSGGADAAESSPQQQLTRLRFFIEHVKRTADRMEQAKSGVHHYTWQQLDMLEEHITQRLLPVKVRMLEQLARQQPRGSGATSTSTSSLKASSTSAPSSGSLFLGGINGKDDATAVSDGWVVGTPTIPDSPGGGSLGASLTSSGDLSGTTSSASLPRPCSSLSFTDLGDLCGDQEGADDACGGVFLVGGDDCDDINGSGIGLDLYDLGQGKESFLTLGREQRVGRWPSISTLSSASATTDGELSDDTISVDADSESFPAGVAKTKTKASASASATTLKTEVPSTPTKAAGATAAAASVDSSERVVAPAKAGIDQEMGELSELFAPDAFLQSTVLDTEMEADGGVARAAAAAAAMDIMIEPTVTEPARPAPSVAAELSAGTHHGANAAAAGGGGGAAAAATVAAAASPAVVKAEYLQASPSPAPAVVSSPSQPAPAVTAAGNSAASPRASSAAAASGPVAPKQECRCGEAACPSLARKRPLLDLSSTSTSSAAGGSGMSGGTPLSLMAGMPYAGLSSRQRKRQRSLAPVLSAPRTVSYECALCKESYPSEISSNPWWSLFIHKCPRCHRMQIPRVDAASAAVSVDYIHAVCAEEGEGCDSDGYGSDSCSDSDDDRPDDGREGLAAFDTDIIAGDAQAGCKEARLSTLQASRLLVLMSHARTCPGRHANPQHADVCRSIKFLMLHMRDCNGYGPNGDPCEHRWCRPCKSLLSHLVRCPMPSTCRICTPLDLPGPLRQLRELNVAQARHAAAAAAAAAARAPRAGVSASAAAPTATPVSVVDARHAAVVKAETMPSPANVTATAAVAVAPTAPTSSLQQPPQQPQQPST
eukprot:g13111.t1